MERRNDNGGTRGGKRGRGRGEGRRRRWTRKGLTANDTVFIVHDGRTTLNPRIFLVSRTCSRERGGAASGTLEAGSNITECAQVYPKRLDGGYSEVHFAFQR